MSATERLAVVLNDAQITAEEIAWGRDLRPLAARLAPTPDPAP